MQQISRLTLPVFCLVFSLPLFAQQKDSDKIDSTLLSVDTATVKGRKYFSFLTADAFYLTNSKGDTLLKQEGNYLMSEFRDIDKDGYKDLALHQSTNTPFVLDLFLFVPSANIFKKVQGFDEFPSPQKIAGTRYFYSYHKSGCADLNWDSDLFYIHDFKTTRLGNIAGRQCDNRDEKDNVYIHKVRGDKEILLKIFPISTLYKYKDFKWGFIKDYWVKNYRLFL